MLSYFRAQLTIFDGTLKQNIARLELFEKSSVQLIHYMTRFHLPLLKLDTFNSTSTKYIEDQFHLFLTMQGYTTQLFKNSNKHLWLRGLCAVHNTNNFFFFHCDFMTPMLFMRLFNLFIT